MYNRNQGQLTLGEDLLYQNLPEDVLAQINRLVNWANCLIKNLYEMPIVASFKNLYEIL